MTYRFESLQQILDIFDGGEKLGAGKISNKLGKSRTIVHKYIKELLKQGKLKKTGKGTHVKYFKTHVDNEEIKFNKLIEEDFILNFQDKKLLDDIFFKLSPDGKTLNGLDGIKKWCVERNMDLQSKIDSYIEIHKYIVNLQDECGLLDASHAFGKDFKKVYLDNICYADQYKRMEFGRGKLAEITFYGKQSQNKKLIFESLDEIIYKLECIIKKEKYDAIAIVPWSIDRKNQLLKILEDKLKPFGKPFVNVIKYYPNEIAIPQKSLKTRNQRIQNAKNTIFVDDKNIGKYKKIFLIDDFVGSGSTLNETAKKLKEEGVKQVDGFAFVGNLNLSYEIINEI